MTELKPIDNWTSPENPPNDDRDVLVKLSIIDYDPSYKVCHYEDGRWFHLFRGYAIEPRECPWKITGWRDIV